MSASCFPVNVDMYLETMHESDNIHQYGTIELKEQHLITVTNHKTKMPT
jgi:hypothetical protein